MVIWMIPDIDRSPGLAPCRFTANALNCSRCCAWVLVGRVVATDAATISPAPIASSRHVALFMALSLSPAVCQAPLRRVPRSRADASPFALRMHIGTAPGRRSSVVREEDCLNRGYTHPAAALIQSAENICCSGPNQIPPASGVFHRGDTSDDRHGYAVGLAHHQLGGGGQFVGLAITVACSVFPLVSRLPR